MNPYKETHDMACKYFVFLRFQLSLLNSKYSLDIHVLSASWCGATFAEVNDVHEWACGMCKGLHGQGDRG